MKQDVTEIKIRGRAVKVPSAVIEGSTVVVTGRWVRTAAVYDEEWLEDVAVTEPEKFLSSLKVQNLKADLFAFAQRLPALQPMYQYRLEWDNVAAIRTSNFQEWWEKQLPQVTRKSVRRGIKRGVTVRTSEFNDDLVKGIIEIHNDSPMRQGTPFAYYGKGFAEVKKDYGTYPDRSEFLCAYFQDELIGIIKLVYMGKIASIMQILTKSAHYDKRPTNLLITDAVKLCEEKGISFLVYGKYVYGNKTQSSLTEFKRRNGFEMIKFPRYYIPLTIRGKIALKFNLHLGLLWVLPARVISVLGDLRSRYIKVRLMLFGGAKQQSRKSVESEI